MDRAELADIDAAGSLYNQVTDPTARRILDFLIDHPDERFDGATIVEHLGIGEHRDVARSTYLIGQIATNLGLKRPWTESQHGYLLPGQAAELLRKARIPAGAPSA